MNLPLGVSIEYVILDIMLALLAFLIGTVVAYWYLKSVLTELQGSQQPSQPPQNEQSILEAERADMAAQLLRDLATHVMSDVGAHNRLVSGIAERLERIEVGSASAPGQLSEVLQQILDANEKLQARLSDAEKKIQTQAEEIKLQQSEARTDSLTQLANRRAFDDCLSKCLLRYHKDGLPSSLILFDVDHFKQFNDTHGHQAGDVVLQQVAISLREVAKTTDLACRYGGEEFGLVMPNTTIAQARIAAERIRQAIEKTAVTFEGLPLSVTASVGVAEIRDDDDATRLVRRSDEAIYCAKAAGRNCGYWHDGEVCLPLDHPGEPKSSPNIAPSYKQLPDLKTFSHELQRRIAESHRFGKALTLIYLRVVGFHAFKREFGSAPGDLLLDSVSQFVGNTLRDMDLLGRAEPGEFILMLPESTERDATIVGNRIQSALANCEIPLGTTRINLQSSLGMARVEPADDSATLISRARESVGSKEELVEVTC